MSDPLALGLPHREPFVFVEEIVEHRPGESALGRKTFSPDEPMFRGHFPGDPLVPGVILTEALAQVAGIAASSQDHALRLAAIKAMKFPAPARPGETIELRAIKTGALAGLVQCAVEARVGAQVVAEGVIVLAEPPVP